MTRIEYKNSLFFIMAFPHTLRLLSAGILALPARPSPARRCGTLRRRLVGTQPRDTRASEAPLPTIVRRGQ